MLVLLSHVNVYYCVLLHILELQLDFMAEGDIGTLDVYKLALAIDLDCQSKEELYVPDIVWAQEKQFHPCWVTKDQVLSWKRVPGNCQHSKHCSQ